MELGSGQGTVRDAAVMMLDLRGFTPLSQRLSPARP
jgi:class 3 adenylate cyclase